jgi:hypothetical protein
MSRRAPTRRGCLAPPLEKGALRGVCGDGQRGTIRLGRVGGTTHSLEQVGSGGVEQVVAAEVKMVDSRIDTFRPEMFDFVHSGIDGHRPGA